MKLYYTTRSPYARKVRIVALEKKIDLELIEADLLNKPKELLSVNPVGKVPTLVLDGGEPIFDSPVICEYLDGLKENPDLIPNDPKERVKVLRAQALGDGIADVVVAHFIERRVHADKANSKYLGRLEQTVTDSLRYLDKHISIYQDFNLGSIAIACALGYLLFRAPRLLIERDHPNLINWYNDLSTRSSLVATVPKEN